MSNLSFEKISNNDLKNLRSISIKTFKQTFAASNSSENMSLYLRNKMSFEKLKQETCDPNTKFYFIKKENKTIGYIKLNFFKAIGKVSALQFVRAKTRNLFVFTMFFNMVTTSLISPPIISSHLP